MQEFVEYIVKKVVNHPEDVVVSENEDERGKVLLVQVNEDDKALLIGKGGRNIKAIRQLAFIVSKNEGESFFVKIEE